MKTQTTINALFLALVVTAGGCSSGTSDDGGAGEPGNPEADNAYLTVVGDANVFLENGWRQTLTLRYHDGNDQALAGQVEFTVMGTAGGATITSQTAVTNAEGLATVDIIAGAEGEAAFTLRAEAEYADATQWTIAVSQGDRPLPPLNVTGRYTVHSELDLVSGLPGPVGEVVNAFADMTDDPYDPATWLIDLLLDKVDNSTVSGAANSFRPALDGVINDLLISIAPGFVQDLLTLGNQFGQVARNFGVVSTLDVAQVGGIEGDELGAVHTMTGMFFKIDSDRFTYSMAELGLQNQAAENLAFRMENENKIYIGEHTFNMPYGAMLLVALDDVIIPSIDPFATDLASLLVNAIDCATIGETISDYVGLGSDSLYEGACQLGINAGASFITNKIRGLEGMDLNLSTGEARPMDTNTDALVDVLLNGAWDGDINYFGSTANLGEASFRGERQALP